MDNAKPLGSANSLFYTKLRAVEDDLASLRGARERMVAAGVRAREVVEAVSEEFTSRTSDDGVATVVCDGLGKVQRVTLDSALYNGVSEQRLCVAVLQARQQARALARAELAVAVKRDGDAPSSAGVLTTMDDPGWQGSAVDRQCAQLAERLRNAKVTATSSQGVVRVVYNGHGDAIELSCKPGAVRRFAADSMAGHFTSALGAADRAVDALHQHAFNDVKIGDDTVAGWRANPDSASAMVAACFGGGASIAGDSVRRQRS